MCQIRIELSRHMLSRFLHILAAIMPAVTANITIFPFYKTNFPFFKTITNFLRYKTNFPFFKTKFRIMILTFHILKQVATLILTYAF